VSRPEYGRAYWIALPIGMALMAFGVVGVVSDKGIATSLDIGAWLVGADVAHDFLLAPLACVVGAVVARALPHLYRAPVQAVLLITGVLFIVVFPALRGYGHDRVPDNPSVQPLDYTTATLTALAVVWAAAAVWLVVRLASAGRETRRPRTRATPGGPPTSRR
jgi:hypothetical protein